MKPFVSQELHIIGAGGHAKVIIALAQSVGLKIKAIYDDNALPEKTILGYPVVQGVDNMPDQEDTYAVIAIGSNAVRRKLDKKFQAVNWATLVHPHSWIAPSVILQAGTVVMAGAIIQPDGVLGRHVIVNTSATVDHDCRLGDYVHVAPGCHLAGNVQLAEGVFAGVGSSFIPEMVVGEWSILGAGTVVNHSLPANVTAVGVPSKVIKARPEGWYSS